MPSSTTSEGPYKKGDTHEDVGIPMRGLRDGRNPDPLSDWELELANAAYAAGQASREQGDCGELRKAAEQVVFASKHRAHDPVALHRLIQEDLAAALQASREADESEPLVTRQIKDFPPANICRCDHPVDTHDYRGGGKCAVKDCDCGYFLNRDTNERAIRGESEMVVAAREMVTKYDALSGADREPTDAEWFGATRAYRRLAAALQASPALDARVLCERCGEIFQPDPCHPGFPEAHYCGPAPDEGEAVKLLRELRDACDAVDEAALYYDETKASGHIISVIDRRIKARADASAFLDAQEVDR